MNTEVLWGGGLWWGLWAGAEGAYYDQKIVDVDDAVAIDVTVTDACAGEVADDGQQVVDVDLAVPIVVTGAFWALVGY